MRCPTLEELPTPPPGREGWPWTRGCPPLPSRMPDGDVWPRLSIVTPSYQQGDYIEETIRSVLLQGYPDIEYVIIDGGSSDGTVATIRKYEPWLAYWCSEPDRGQAHAINKGRAHLTGLFFQFINSDDVLAENALEVVARHARQHRAVAGTVATIGTSSPQLVRNTTLSVEDLILGSRDFHQPGIWVNREDVENVGGFDENFHFVFDKDFYIRFMRKNMFSIARVQEKLAFFRLHEESKTAKSHKHFIEEEFKMLGKYIDDEKFLHFRQTMEERREKIFWRAQKNAAREYHTNKLHRNIALVMLALRRAVQQRLSWRRRSNERRRRPLVTL